MTRTVLAAFALLACLAIADPSAAANQDPEPAQLGDRVRVTCPALSPSSVIGTLVSTSAHELVVEQADGPVPLRRDAVVALEKSLGRRPRRSTRIAGALLGGLAAAASQGAKSCSPLCETDSPTSNRCLNTCDFEYSGWEVAFGVAGIAAGAAIGLGVGSLFKVERWERATGPTLSLEAAPTRGGARVSFSLRF